MSLRIRGVRVELGGRPVVDGVDLDVGAGQMAGIVGPNGSGKTTLLRAAYRSLRPTAGTVLLAGRDGDVDVRDMSPKALARRIAVLNQERSEDFELSVWEVVLTGRTPHKRLLERDSAADHRLVGKLLAEVGMDWAAGRYFSSLSGGEKQRVLLAKALAQQTEVLLLDEPTNHLDVAAQCGLLDMLRERVEEHGLIAVAVLHDLNLAAAFTDHLVVMQRGTVAAAGPPADVLTEELIEAVFGVRAHCGVHPVTGELHVAIRMGDRFKRRARITARSAAAEAHADSDEPPP